MRMDGISPLKRSYHLKHYAAIVILQDLCYASPCYRKGKNDEEKAEPKPSPASVIKLVRIINHVIIM